MSFGFMFSLILALVAIVSAFILIPYVSGYAFWCVVAAYVILAGSRRW